MHVSVINGKKIKKFMDCLDKNIALKARKEVADQIDYIRDSKFSILSKI